MADLRSIRGKKTDSTNDDNNSQNDKQENDEKNNYMLLKNFQLGHSINMAKMKLKIQKRKCRKIIYQESKIYPLFLIKHLTNKNPERTREEKFQIFFET